MYEYFINPQFKQSQFRIIRPTPVRTRP